MAALTSGTDVCFVVSMFISFLPSNDAGLSTDYQEHFSVAYCDVHAYVLPLRLETVWGKMQKIEPTSKKNAKTGNILSQRCPGGCPVGLQQTAVPDFKRSLERGLATVGGDGLRNWLGA